MLHHHRSSWCVSFEYTTTGFSRRGGPHVPIIRNMSPTEIQHDTGSIEGQEHDEVQKKVKSRRPASKTASPAIVYAR